jgi:RES domain-containing protein
MKRTGWRIVPEGQSANAFDGEGARRYGGRWNSPGVAMVYASEHQSLAAMEVRVHIEAVRKAMSYKCFAFHFEESLMEIFQPKLLPDGWRQEPPLPSLQQLGDNWAGMKKSVLLAVPSIIIPNELNYLINPKHPDFSKIEIEPPTDFMFDPRLFK